MNVRETPYTLEYLEAYNTYEIDVQLVIDRSTQSPFTDATYVFTGRLDKVYNYAKRVLQH